MRLMNSFYINFFQKLYKKYIKQILIRSGIFFLLIENKNTYNLILSLENCTLTQFKILGDICISDYPEMPNRFEVSYNLLSVKYNTRLFVKTRTDSYLTSLSTIFKSAN